MATIETKYMLALLEKIAANTSGTTIRAPLDHVVMISATTPWILDYKERKHIFAYSATALILSIEDIGKVSLSANAWTSLDFLPGARIFATGQTANVPLFVRATDEQINPGNTLASASLGAVTAFASNPAALTTSTDYAFKWGNTGTTQVNHVMLQNNTASALNYDLDAVATLGSPALAAGQTIFLDVQTLVVHLFQAGTPNVNGTSASNIVVRGWI